MKRTTAYLLILTILISLFSGFTVLAEAASYDAAMLSALGIADNDINDNDGYVTRGQFAEYIARMANGGKKVTREEAIGFVLENGYINNAASGDFEADMPIRNDVAVKAMLQIRDILLKSDRLRTSAKNNTVKDFEFSYFDDIDDALIEGLEQNQDFFSLLLSNDEIKHQVLGIFTDEIYKSLRNS